MATAICERCKHPCTVTYSARGTQRRHKHKCPHGKPCTYPQFARNKDVPDCSLCLEEGANEEIARHALQPLTPAEIDRMIDLYAYGPMTARKVDEELRRKGWLRNYDGTDAVEPSEAAYRRDSNGRQRETLRDDQGRVLESWRSPIEQWMKDALIVLESDDHPMILGAEDWRTLERFGFVRDGEPGMALTDAGRTLAEAERPKLSPEDRRRLGLRV